MQAGYENEKLGSLSCRRDLAMLCFIDYFDKSLKIIRNDTLE